jgi:UDP-N-acetylmuramoyl-L-alanyl-D-glutamate--2,6-diaminopimelate ligase
MILQPTEDFFPNGSRPYFDLRQLDRIGVRIDNLVTDSRTIKPGDTFLAYVGDKQDGRKFIPQAVAAGASAIIWEGDGFEWNSQWKIPNLRVFDLRTMAGAIADHVYHHPSRKLQLVGITGTNGKTSCSHWLAQSMTTLGRKTAIIGTMGAGFPGALEPAVNTTPDAVLLQRKMADFLSSGATAVAMEVSSHGIMQERVSGSTFAIAMLTNLSRDHLDYHGSMAAYAAAKARLFRWPGLKYAVLNLDDAFGAELTRHLAGDATPPGMQILGYGFRELKGSSRAREEFKVLQGRNLRVTPQGLAFEVEFGGKSLEFKTGLLGDFNASNLLGVLAALLAGGVGLEEAARALQDVRPVAGRMQQLGGGENPLIIIDYAHTPDALARVLTTLRKILRADSGRNAGMQQARLICVFGCGGERDRGKRPLMGEAATRLSDEVFITSDNPRQEDLNVIIREIESGAVSGYHVEKDRAAAIKRAIHGARRGDVVLIAGKGHEAYQEIEGKRFPFDDAKVARRVLFESDMASK